MDLHAVRTAATVVRALAETYALPWPHWRAALHFTRVLTALRWLAAPNVTTETVGLPSPGALTRAARRDVLASWANL